MLGKGIPPTRSRVPPPWSGADFCHVCGQKSAFANGSAGILAAMWSRGSCVWTRTTASLWSEWGKLRLFEKFEDAALPQRTGQVLFDQQTKYSIYFSWFSQMVKINNIDSNHTPHVEFSPVLTSPVSLFLLHHYLRLYATFYRGRISQKCVWESEQSRNLTPFVLEILLLEFLFLLLLSPKRGKLYDSLNLLR